MVQVGEAWLLVSRAFQAGGLLEPMATAEAALQRALCTGTSYRKASLVPLPARPSLCAGVIACVVRMRLLLCSVRIMAWPQCASGVQVGRLPASEMTALAAASSCPGLIGDMHVAPAVLPGRTSALLHAHQQRLLQVALPAL